MQLTIDSSIPSCADWYNNGMIKLKSFWLICLSPYLILHLILITLSLIQYFAFKGCSWRPIPAHPWCACWHKYGNAECASSRAFNWYAELCNMSFDQDFVTYLKPRCWFIDSLKATTSGSKIPLRTIIITAMTPQLFVFLCPWIFLNDYQRYDTN